MILLTLSPLSLSACQLVHKNLVWGANAKDKGEPVRVEKAFPAIVTEAQFQLAAFRDLLNNLAGC